MQSTIDTTEFSNKFLIPTSSSDILKFKLLSRAAAGRCKPSRFSADVEECILANALNNFVSPESEAYDLNFDENIHVSRPDWFIDEHEINKAKLLDAAKKNWRDQEIIVYMGFYLVKTSHHFDIKLYDGVKSMRPDWFKYLV